MSLGSPFHNTGPATLNALLLMTADFGSHLSNLINSIACFVCRLPMGTRNASRHFYGTVPMSSVETSKVAPPYTCLQCAATLDSSEFFYRSNCFFSVFAIRNNMFGLFHVSYISIIIVYSECL